MAKATAFYRRNPQATLKEVAQACDISERTAHKARQQMVFEGICKPSRKKQGRAPTGEPTPRPEPPAPPSLPAAPAPNALIDGEQLALLGAGDTSGIEEADPETRKKMLRELRSIAFTTTNHPDTQVTAMKAWFALKDAAAAKDIGPGKPKTREDVISRLGFLDQAVGIELAIDALLSIFDIGTVLQAFERIVKGAANAQAMVETVAPSTSLQPVEQADNDSGSKEPSG